MEHRKDRLDTGDSGWEWRGGEGWGGVDPGGEEMRDREREVQMQPAERTNFGVGGCLVGVVEGVVVGVRVSALRSRSDEGKDKGKDQATVYSSLWRG